MVDWCLDGLDSDLIHLVAHLEVIGWLIDARMARIQTFRLIHVVAHLALI